MDTKLVSSMDELEKLVSSRMRDYEEKLQKATTGTNPDHSDLASLSQDFTDFKSFVFQTLSQLRTQLELLFQGFENHETFMRRKVLLIHGVPEKPNEKMFETVVDIISKQMKIDDVNSDHLEVCHRLGTTEGKTRPVLVRFISMEHRRLVWDGKTALKGSGITVSEFLTKTRHRVFMAARKHFGIKSCWSAEGRINILTPDKSRRKIASLRELEALMALFPASADDPVATNPAPLAAVSPKAAASKVTSRAPRKARR